MSTICFFKIFSNIFENLKTKIHLKTNQSLFNSWYSMKWFKIMWYDMKYIINIFSIYIRVVIAKLLLKMYIYLISQILKLDLHLKNIFPTTSRIRTYVVKISKNITRYCICYFIFNINKTKHLNTFLPCFILYVKSF